MINRGPVPLTPPVTVGPQTCATLSGGGADREWLVTDGLGGYATGTVSGLRTRRYHALLVVADPRTGVRHAGLASLDLTVTLPSGATVALHTHEWASGAVAPQGHRHLETFTLADGLPRWRWRVGDVVVERELAYAHGSPSLAVVHRVVAAPGPVGLSVAALCTWRDAHSTRRASGPAPVTRQVAGGVVVEDAYRLAGPGWQPTGEWYLDAFARAEAARGHDAVEDLWLAGRFTARLGAGAAMEISAWAGDLAVQPPPAATVVAAARERAHRLVAAAKPVDDLAAQLVLAADAFVVTGPDVVAAYPWSGSHAGDTMAAYEGLFLCTGRAGEGRELLTAAVTGQAPEPGPWRSAASPDAPLWLVHAVDRHVARTGDTDLAAALLRPLGRLLRASLDGTGPLTVDPADQLVRLAPGTPRTGKPVEINALWVNALGAMAALSEEAGRDGGRLRTRHRVAAAAFTDKFAAPDGWLHDVVEGPPAPYPLGAGATHDDPTLRPSQLLAWSLPHAPLAGTHAGGVRAAGAALLTPMGLRTLAPGEYGYQGAHAGPPGERDIAYHQGTVWPWLIGPYADACRATGLPTEGLLAGLEAHVREWGVGSISESADGDAPHRATGSPFSARAVAEVLRVRGYAA
ncbi:glycogen debranching enzyme N-terminal domain-containing protein [Spirilliplanes yamanashiensis]|uniref:Glycogen debranching protein n=1 Tax=Spirilliplanes yamanashiensis TaxID=42233 RepID=A0A8J4DKT2_9ACTN|nr:glycogen debranching enzyme N-terminal domain-containing protein [Spirilliplanes yamanashiensis]MDP9818792.1 putative glycogen debranching enzyme [Spirilliplanes yamanashiensis]GIJ05246.1 glycogen debranching protein [Spirilliplanes yamanashiensis]